MPERGGTATADPAPPPPAPPPAPSPPEAYQAPEPVAAEPAIAEAAPVYGAEPEPAPGFAAFEQPAEAPPASYAAPEPDLPPPDSLAAERLPPITGDIREVADEDTYSQFESEPPFRPRRNPLRLWTWAAAIFAVVATGSVVAVNYWGLPDWVPVSHPTFGLGQDDLVLDFPPGDQDRRQLPNGTEFFNASGTVTNVGRVARNLPPILIVLRDGRDRIVYSWEVNPPQRTLAPGESVTINEAMIDVPKAAKFAEIGWKPG